MSRAKAIVEEFFSEHGFHTARTRRLLSDFISLHLDTWCEVPYSLEWLNQLGERMADVSAESLVERAMLPDYPEMAIDLMVGGLDDDELMQAVTNIANDVGGTEGQELLRKAVGHALEGPESETPAG